MSENLGLATAALARRLTDIETPRGSTGVNEAAPRPKQIERQASGMLPGVDANQQPLSPAWSTVLKEGKQKVDVSLRPGLQNHLKRERERKGGIIGPRTARNITVVKTKLVSVFATRCPPDLNAGILCAYLAEKLGKSVTCQKIDSTHNRLSSFHITAECNEVADMYGPQLWLLGVYVRCYFEARRQKMSDSVRSTRVSETCTQRENSENVFAHVAPQGSNGHADWDE